MSIGIGIGEGTERYLGFDAYVIAPRPESTEGGGQVSQAVTKGKLTKAHTKQLITTRECFAR